MTFLTRAQPLLDLLLRAVSHCFADGRLFDNMEDDLSKTEEGLQWHVRRSTSHLFGYD